LSYFKTGVTVLTDLHFVILLHFSVNFLLLLAANTLTGHIFAWKREILAGILGGIYAGACLLPGFAFLGNWLWRMIALVLLCMVAFGFQWSAIPRGMVFSLLIISLEGLAVYGNTVDWRKTLLYAGCVFFICFISTQWRMRSERFATLRLWYGGKSREVTALMDTGNTLQDPITAEPVIILGRELAEELTGLCPEELASPMETIAARRIPGLRLIPFRSVGCSNGMLLCLRMDRVTLNGKDHHTLVAFAPDQIGNDGYQALAGGIL